MPTSYFAYGSNMDALQMQERCPDAVLISVGMIQGWRFRINTRGVATIVPEEESVVYGIAWLLSRADEKTLDYYEEINIGLYRKTRIEVHVDAERRLGSLVYLAEDNVPATPRPGYLEAIVGAAIACRLPCQYVDELQTWAKTDG